MAVSVIPKSEVRRKSSISHGYGEIPLAKSEDGQTGWALPGKVITFCYDEAMAAAKQIDITIRSNLTDPKQIRN
jgi:hypothetical protein